MNTNPERPKILLAGIQGEDLDRLRAILGPDSLLQATLDHERIVSQAIDLRPDLIILEGALTAHEQSLVCRSLRQDPRCAAIPLVLVAGEGVAAGEALERCEAWAEVLCRPFSSGVVRRRVAALVELKRLRELARQTQRAAAELGYGDAAFASSCEREWVRSVRGGSFLSLLVLSMEGAGLAGRSRASLQEELLRACAAVVHRKTDYVGRLADHRVACLLPETDLDGALEVARRMRQALAAAAAWATPFEGGSLAGL